MLCSWIRNLLGKKEQSDDDGIDPWLWQDNFDFTYDLSQFPTFCVVAREMWPNCDIDTLNMLMELLEKLPSNYQYLVRGRTPYLLFTHEHMMAYIRALWRTRKYWRTSIDYDLEIRAYPMDLKIPIEETEIKALVAERTALFEVFTSMENDLFTFQEAVHSPAPLSSQTVADWIRAFAKEHNKTLVEEFIDEK